MFSGDPRQKATFYALRRYAAHHLSFLFKFFVVALTFVSGVGAKAASLQWDANGAAPGTGGSGTWNTSSALWFNGSIFQNWSNATLDDAAFGGTAGTVTLGVPITAHSLTFDTSGYTVTGSTLTLAGASPSIAVVLAGSATVGSVVAGAGGLTQTGPGTLILTGTNTYTGGTTISAGTLQVGAGGTTGSIVGDVIDNGVLAFNRSNALTYAGVISGTGSLTQAGTGTTTLTGANTYTGGTTISAGTLQVGAGGTTGSILGNVLDNGVLAFNRSDATTFNGVISGTGSVTKSGAGTQTFTGDNTYTGTTTISAGTLQLGNGGTTGSIAGNIVDNSALVINRSNALTLAGVISGTGSLTQAGTGGTTTLTGANTYTGGTTISAGTLQVGADANLGNAAGAITFAGGTLQYLASFASNRTITLNAGGGTIDTNGNIATLSGIIGGPGGLTKSGAGTLVLSNANTYSGGTTLAAGTLRLENNRALGTGALTTTGSVVDYASGIAIANSFVVNSNATQIQVTTGSAIQAGVISELNGPRPIEKIGAGTLVLTAANTYAGPTTITGGTLQIGNGSSSGSLVGNIINNATFVINRSDNYIFDNVISGTGAFQQNGNGATMLTAINSYVGSTTVNSGALIVNGSIASSNLTTVNAGAALGGSGTVGSTTIATGGTFAPGPTGAPGTMAVSGNLAFQSGARYVVQVNPTTASTTNVSGTASLAGTVQANFLAGSFVERSYTILTAGGGRIGTFDGLTTPGLPASFGTSLNYTGNTAVLNLTAQLVPPPNPPPTPPGPPGPPTPAVPPPPTFTVNQLNVGNTIDNFFNNGGALPSAFVPLFGLSGNNLTHALDQLSGEAATGTQRAASSSPTSSST
jgi:fibronectin-binding autotransporter adhesin